MRVLFFVPHTALAAGARYRVYQFLPYLQAAGIDCTVRAFTSPELYGLLYGGGHELRRAGLILARSLQRLKDVAGAGQFDAFFVYKECFPFGPPLIEEHLKSLGKPLIYDFDDAIFLPESTRLRQRLRSPDKVARIVTLADRVIVSNQHLAGFSSAYNRNVEIIPTCIDMSVFVPKPCARATNAPLRIGWIGSHSTAKYLERLGLVFSRLAARFDFELHVIGAGRTLRFPGVRSVERAWRLEAEVGEFQDLDIGVYPLGDSVWELGKAGFKAIQYMAVGVPSVSSPVGVMNEIVRDGTDGFLADSDDEWFDKLSRLLSDADLRRRMAERGREAVEQRFSLSANAPKLVEAIRATVAGRAVGGAHG